MGTDFFSLSETCNTECLEKKEIFNWFFFIFSPIISAGTLVNLAARTQSGSCCPLVTLEEPISSERVKLLRVISQTTRFVYFLIFFISLLFKEMMLTS